MPTLPDCRHNTDPLKLIREGTGQDQRFADALNPSYAPVDEHKPEHWMTFAQAYAKYLQYFDVEKNTVTGDWVPFFGKDVSVLLAVAAVQEVDQYKSRVKDSFALLNNKNKGQADEDLKSQLGYLFSYVGTLARQLEALKEGLPRDASLPPDIVSFKSTLQNLIKSQLAPVFERLIGYYKASKSDPLNLIVDTAPDEIILGSPAIVFGLLYRDPFSKDWITTEVSDWRAYVDTIESIDIDGSGEVFDQINRIVTHNLFTSIFDQFLKAYARVVNEAQKTLQATFKWDGHDPHYSLFLAFLKLFEQVTLETNTLTQRHLDFYYKDVLKLKDKPPVAGHAHLLVELAKHVETHELKIGELFKAGKDARKIDAFFANDREFVANQAKVKELRTVYRHGDEPVVAQDATIAQAVNNQGRVFASPIANSADGMGAELTTVDHSWHPLFNKIYRDEQLVEIKMPKAEIGFAIASHYLWMAEGERIITINFTVPGNLDGLQYDRKDDFACLLTSEKGWITKTATKFMLESGALRLELNLSGADPAVTPYLTKIHGFAFDTSLPILLIKLKHSERGYAYNAFQDVVITKINLSVKVGDVKQKSKSGLKTLAISNDFGAVDASKPFQPFGAQPVNGANFLIGSKEIFQKKLSSLSLFFDWQNWPSFYESKTPNVTTTAPKVDISYLNFGKWSVPTGDFDFKSDQYFLNIAPNNTELETHDLTANELDLTANELYNIASRCGYFRLVLDGDLGFKQYQIDLANFLAKIDPKPPVHPGAPILGPYANSVSIAYIADQDIELNPENFLEEKYKNRSSIFFHVTPFGFNEQHPYLKNKFPDTETNLPDKAIYLLPQLRHINTTDNKRLERVKGEHVPHEAEFYIGITGLKLPQNIACLMQVVDGTADPRLIKPEQHIHWSYLRENEWVSFASNEVQDQTGGLINSGIVTFAMPRDASNNNTILPEGMHWLRAAVKNKSETVCRLQLVAAQALSATFTDRGNDPEFSAQVLSPGKISKLEQPDADVKQITQPFPSFGGRGQEAANAFYARVSERLRHKDRAIALWDYERLVLEAFPQIYKVKCLNHTQWETDKQGNLNYMELAPGHVTLVTLPNQSFLKLRDPLKPFTSQGLLAEIEVFLKERVSCFVKPHVINPQFEEVFVDFKVSFREGVDQSFHENKLQEAITRFLSPWAFSDNAHPSFSGKIYKATLINFVEELPYVDYVTDFKLFHTLVSNKQKNPSEKNEVEGSTAVSILVSAPKHNINVITLTEQTELRETCRCES